MLCLGQERKHLRGSLAIAVLLSLLPLLAMPAGACSVGACADSGVEVNRNFVVVVKHDGRPLAGVTVQIIANAGNGTHRQFSGVTDSDGKLQVANLPAGDYWLDAELLGITAAYHCFHVGQRTSRKAKRRLTYEWGEFAPATRRIAGRLVDSQPGTGESPLWNLVRRVNVPISEARLRLQNPITGDAFKATSDQDGIFEFGSVPQGTYVLHVEGGKSGRVYDATDLLVELSPTATRNTLVLMRSDADGCGGTSLGLTTAID